MTAHETFRFMRGRPLLDATMFTLAFGLLLLAEWAMLPAGDVQAPLLPCAGLLAGALTISRLNRWPVLIGIALVLRTVFVLALASVGAGMLVLQTVGVTAAALLVSAAPWFADPEHAFELAPNEFAARAIIVGLGACVAFGLLHFLAIEPASVTSATSASLSLMLGLLTVSPAVVVLGRYTHMARPASPRRHAAVILSAAAFTVTAMLAIGFPPASMPDWVRVPGTAWLWLSMALGIVMALRSHVITSLLIVMSVVLAAALVQFAGDTHPQPARAAAIVDWQASALGLLVILTIATALVGSKRRASDERRTQEGISRIMLGRTERAIDDTDDAGDEFAQALALVAALGGADKAFMYWIDETRRRIGVAHAWPEPHGPAGGDPAAEIPIDDVRGALEPLFRGRSMQLDASNGESIEVRDALRRLGLGDGGSILLQPIVFGARVVAATALLNSSGRPFRRHDVTGPMTTIAEFYVSDRTREHALTSVRNYQRRLRELAARTVQAEERVRRETAVELHDGLIQRLAVARMKLGELRHRLGGEGPVGAVTDIVDESLTASRAIIHALSPSVLYELGLMPGLERLTEERRERDGFDVTLREHGNGQPLDESVRVGVYHVVEELVSNSIAHSGGDRVWIDVYWEQTALDAVVVSDNGRSEAWWLTETRPGEPAGLGLLSASERLRPIGYDIKFERRDGGGTRAIVFSTAAIAA